MSVQKSKSKALPIVFDNRRPLGSVQHYWHFMFGYFLPLMEYLLCSPGSLRPAKLVVQDCGPVMTPVLGDALSRLPLVYSLQDKQKLNKSRLSRLGRWRIVHGFLRGRNKRIQDLPEDRPVLLRGDLLMPRWDRLFHLDCVNDSLFLRLVELRQALERLLVPSACCDKGGAEGKYLILKRSAQPAFYGSQGAAEIKGYGSGRRSLEGIEVGIEKLCGSGIPVVSYEPGAHNLGCQIAHFGTCAGVVGVRGAEFANLVWMQEKALAIMIDTAQYSHPPAQASLARTMRLCYCKLGSQNVVSPQFDPAEILPLLQEHRQLLSAG